jgi:hypothetical protein
VWQDCAALMKVTITMQNAAIIRSQIAGCDVLFPRCK